MARAWPLARDTAQARVATATRARTSHGTIVLATSTSIGYGSGGLSQTDDY
jgi:hypothetical protein